MKEALLIDPTQAKASVYYDFKNAKGNHVHLVKVSFTDLGIYINSITVQPSPKYPGTLWVQAPRFNIRGTWVWPVQLEKKSPFKKLIETLALKAVDEFTRGDHAAVFAENTATPYVRRESEFL